MNNAAPNGPLRGPSPLLLSLLSLAAIATACGESSSHHEHGADAGADAAPGEISAQCQEEERADVFTPGMALVGEAGFTVELVSSAPSPLAKGDHDWEFQITAPAGESATGLELRAAPFMPDHGHGTPRIAEPTELGEGRYTIAPINLFMAGYWIVKVRLFRGETELDSATFRFCI